jgi:hypothetical protein
MRPPSHAGWAAISTQPGTLKEDPQANYHQGGCDKKRLVAEAQGWGIRIEMSVMKYRSRVFVERNAVHRSYQVSAKTHHWRKKAHAVGSSLCELCTRIAKKPPRSGEFFYLPLKSVDDTLDLPRFDGYSEKPKVSAEE